VGREIRHQTDKLRFLDRVLEMASTFMVPISPNDSTSSMCFEMSYVKNQPKERPKSVKRTWMQSDTRLGKRLSSKFLMVLLSATVFFFLAVGPFFGGSIPDAFAHG
jgi:hypothetical protein